MDRPLKFLSVLLLTLAACSSPSGTAIRLQAFGDAEEIAGYRALIAAFEKTHDDIAVHLDAVPQQGDHVAKLVTSFAGGNPPDLFLVNYRRFGQFAAKGVLEPLGARLGGDLTESDFYSEALDAFRFDGTQQCLPQNISSLVVYYNTTLFAEAGVSVPSADWTWSDFLAAAKKLTRDTNGDGRIDVYGLGTEPSLIRLAPFVWQAGGEMVDSDEEPTRLTLLDPASLEAVEFFVSLRREHGVTPSLAEAESEDLEDRFLGGRLGMFFDSRKFTPAARAVESLKWDVAPLPRGKEAATVLHADAYCMSNASKRKDEAAEFIRFALGPEGARIVAASGRTVPSLRSVAESDAFLDPTKPPRNARVWLDQIPRIRRLPNVAQWNEVETKADPIVEEWYYSTEAVALLGVEIDFETLDILRERG